MTQPRPFESADVNAVSDRRRDVRIRQNTLNSNLGQVMDLSRSGMRVLSPRRLKGPQSVVVFARQGPHLQVMARVVWSERIGFRKHMIGLEFVEDPPARQLANICTSG